MRDAVTEDEVLDEGAMLGEILREADTEAEVVAPMLRDGEMEEP